LRLGIGRLGHRRCHTNLRLAIDRDLGIGGLRQGLGGPVLHDPGVGIGEIARRFGSRLGLLRVGHHRHPTFGFLSRLRLASVPLGNLGLGCGRRLLGLCLGFLLQGRLRLANLA
jgi:hypothetical protein